MLHSLDLDVPIVNLQIASRSRKNKQPVGFKESAVLTSSWQSPEGNVGHCLVNITDKKQMMQLHLDTRNAPGWDKADVDLYRADKSHTGENVMRSVALPRKYALELEPLEAVFFVIRPAKCEI